MHRRERLQQFTSDDLAAAPFRWGYTGVGLSHTPDTRDCSYRGTAPDLGTWHALIDGLGADPG